MPLSFFGFFAYVALFPAILFWVIRKMPTHWQDIQFLARYNTFLYRFQANKYYWSAWITCRKFLIAFAITIITNNPIIQRTSTIAIILFSLVIHTYHQPYRYDASRSVQSLIILGFVNVIFWKHLYKF